MKKYISGRLQHFAKDEILSMVPPDTLTRIKQTDKRPEFRVYCVGHEGTADARELSFGARFNKAFDYVKDMIIKLGERLTLGTVVFNRHVETNEHTGREQIGELVGKGLRYIKDKLSALAAVYIYPQYRKLPLDVASIEADIEYIPKSKDRGEVIDVDRITGIALSSSAIDEPAFKGATLLGIVQAFTKEKGDKMTKEEILEGIKELNLKVTDIFAPEEITASEPAKKAKQTEYEHAKRIEKSLGEERERVITLTKERDDAQGKIKTLNERVSNVEAGKLFETAATTRKLDNKEKAFITKNLGTFKSTAEGDALKTDFDKFLDAQLVDYQTTAKLLGVDVTKDKNQLAGAPSGDGTEIAAESDLENPERNEFIPKP